MLEHLVERLSSMVGAKQVQAYDHDRAKRNGKKLTEGEQRLADRLRELADEVEEGLK